MDIFSSLYRASFDPFCYKEDSIPDGEASVVLWEGWGEGVVVEAGEKALGGVEPVRSS